MLILITVQKRKKNFFLSATRQISNTTNNSATSPKMIAIIKTIKTGLAKPVIIFLIIAIILGEVAENISCIRYLSCCT